MPSTVAAQDFDKLDTQAAGISPVCYSQQDQWLQNNAAYSGF